LWRPKAVITGVGVVSSIGRPATAFWESCVAGSAGLTTLPWAAAFGCRSRVGGVVDIERSVLAAAADTGDAASALGAVDYINAHDSGTEPNDLAEAAAFRAIFGPRLRAIPVNSTKALTGHALGAAGLIEAVHVALSIRPSTVTPVVNVETADPAIDLTLAALSAIRVRHLRPQREVATCFVSSGSLS
jgi:3-oxoacyl-(acyl-carrier-protein) synthase